MSPQCCCMYLLTFLIWFPYKNQQKTSQNGNEHNCAMLSNVLSLGSEKYVTLWLLVFGINRKTSSAHVLLSNNLTFFAIICKKSIICCCAQMLKSNAVEFLCCTYWDMSKRNKRVFKLIQCRLECTLLRAFDHGCRRAKIVQPTPVPNRSKVAGSTCKHVTW